MAEEQARRRRSLLARLLGRRPAETEAASEAGSAHSAPLLLDQVSSQELMRLASDRLGPDIHLPAAGAAATAVSARTGRPVLRPLIRRTLLPLAFLGLGAVMVAGLSFGTVAALTDEGGVSGADFLRLAVMGLVSLSVAGQGFAVFRSLPGGRWLFAQPARLSRRLVPLLPGRPPAAAGASPLLDQVSSQQLMRLAPENLGQASAFASAGRTGWRAAEGSSWFALLLVVMALVAFTVAGLAFSVVRSLTGGSGIGIGVGLQIVFLAMMTFALVSLGVMAVRSLADRRRRRRRRLLMRLLRYLLRLFDRGRSAVGRGSGAALGGGGIPLRLTTMALATATVAGLGFAPSLTEGSGDGGAPQALGVAATPAPTPADEQLTAVSTPAVAAPTTVVASALTPLPNDTGQDAGAPTTGAGASDGVTPAPASELGAGTAPTPTSVPGAKPTPTPQSTPTAMPKPTAAPPAPDVDLVPVSANLKCDRNVVVQIQNIGSDDMALQYLVTVEVTLGRVNPKPYSAIATKIIKLAAKASTDFTVVLPVPLDDCQGGPAKPEPVTVVVDSTNVVPESNEGNNSAKYTLTLP